MGKDLPGWYYVGDGQKRYMDADGWTDQYKAFDDPYKPINEPPVRAGLLNSEPTNSGSPSPATANKLPGAKKPHRRAPPLVLAFCLGLLALGVGGGLLKANVFPGWAAWATEQAGQISAFISPPSPTAQAIAAKPKAKAKAKTPVKAAAPKPPAPKTGAPKPVATKHAVRPAAPAPAAPIQPKPNPGWDGRGYTKADYADRVGQVAVWVGYVREDSGLELATHTDLVALGQRFKSIGVMPAPPGVDPAWWAAETSILSQFSQQAADEWANGDQMAAMGRFEAIVEESNNLITKVNKAFGLHVALSKTIA